MKFVEKLPWEMLIGGKYVAWGKYGLNRLLQRKHSDRPVHRIKFFGFKQIRETNTHSVLTGLLNGCLRLCITLTGCIDYKIISQLSTAM